MFASQMSSFSQLEKVTKNKQIKSWVKSAGIDKEITFHCFRHTFATLLLSEGVSIYEISKLLSTNALGPTIDYSDVISAGTRVSGVDSINISRFNVSGKSGRKSFIKALENQTINPGNIFLEAVSRKDFRIS